MSPALEQAVYVNSLIRFGRKIVAKGNAFTPDEAVEFRALMDRVATVFGLPFPNDDDSPEQSAVRAAMTEPA